MADYFYDPGSGDNGTGDGSTGSPFANLDNLLVYIAANATASEAVTIYGRGATADTVKAIELGLDAVPLASLTFDYEAGFAGHEVTDTYALYIRDMPFPVTINRFKGKAILTSAFTTGNEGFIRIDNNTAGITVHGDQIECEVQDDGSTSGNFSVVYMNESDVTDATLNNIRGFVSGSSGKAGGASLRGISETNGSIKVYTSAFKDFNIGLSGLSAAKAILLPGCTTAVSGGTTANHEKIYVDDSSGGSDGKIEVADWSTHITSLASRDYAPVASGPLDDTGTDYSAENGGVSTDAEGTARGATWDISPIESAGGADTTAPAQTTAAVVDSVSDTTITVDSTYNDPSGPIDYYWAAVTDAGTAPTEAQMIAGTGGAIVNGQSNLNVISATEAQSTLTGLSVSTAYDLYYYIEDDAGNGTAVTKFADQSTTAAANPGIGSLTLRNFADDADAADGSIDYRLTLESDDSEVIDWTTVTVTSGVFPEIDSASITAAGTDYWLHVRRGTTPDWTGGHMIYAVSSIDLNA